MWSNINVWTLINFSCLEDLRKYRACYLEVNRDPLVLCTADEEHAGNMAENLKYSQKEPTVYDLFYFLPQKLISKFNADKANESFVGPLNKRQHNNLFKT